MDPFNDEVQRLEKLWGVEFTSEGSDRVVQYVGGRRNRKEDSESLLYSDVKEYLLNEDIRKTNIKSPLPDNFQRQAETLLPDIRIFTQVQRVRDVAKPSVDDRVAGDADKKRLLLLTCHDGTQKFFALDAGKCSNFSLKLIPGTKLLLQSTKKHPLLVKYGYVVVFQNENVEILGGFVKTLAEAYRTEQQVHAARKSIRAAVEHVQSVVKGKETAKSDDAAVALKKENKDVDHPPSFQMFDPSKANKLVAPNVAAHKKQVTPSVVEKLRNVSKTGLTTSPTSPQPNVSPQEREAVRRVDISCISGVERATPATSALTHKLDTTAIRHGDRQNRSEMFVDDDSSIRGDRRRGRGRGKRGRGRGRNRDDDGEFDDDEKCYLVSTRNKKDVSDGVTLSAFLKVKADDGTLKFGADSEKAPPAGGVSSRTPGVKSQPGARQFGGGGGGPLPSGAAGAGQNSGSSSAGRPIGQSASHSTHTYRGNTDRGQSASHSTHTYRGNTDRGQSASHSTHTYRGNTDRGQRIDRGYRRGDGGYRGMPHGGGGFANGVEGFGSYFPEAQYTTGGHNFGQQDNYSHSGVRGRGARGGFGPFAPNPNFEHYPNQYY